MTTVQKLQKHTRQLQNANYNFTKMKMKTIHITYKNAIYISEMTAEVI